MSTEELVQQLARALRARGWRPATAESCTGGLIASFCTDMAGSSQWFERGFVTYSNAAKCEMLGVDPALIAAHGAVSQAVAQAMALGALKHSQAKVAVAVTGVAGPSGGSADKPVGTVWLAWACVDECANSANTNVALSATNATTPMHIKTKCMHFSGDRAVVREATVAHALRGLLAVLA